VVLASGLSISGSVSFLNLPLSLRESSKDFPFPLSLGEGTLSFGGLKPVFSILASPLPIVEEKEARLAYALTKNHAFIDGNKRIGMLAMLATLRLNHYEIKFSQDDLIALGIGVADGSYSYDQVLLWIRNRVIYK